MAIAACARPSRTVNAVRRPDCGRGDHQGSHRSHLAVGGTQTIGSVCDTVRRRTASTINRSTREVRREAPRPESGSSAATDEEPRRAEGVRGDAEEDVLPEVDAEERAVAVMKRTLPRTDRSRLGEIRSPKATTTWKPVHEIPSVTPAYSVDRPSGLPVPAARPVPGRARAACPAGFGDNTPRPAPGCRGPGGPKSHPQRTAAHNPTLPLKAMAILSISRLASASVAAGGTTRRSHRPRPGASRQTVDGECWVVVRRRRTT